MSTAETLYTPFSADSPKYFLTPELNQRINLICHLIENSDQLLLVLADAGYGKTSLLNHLKKTIKQQHEHWWIYTPTSSPALSVEVLISAILTAFNVRQEGKPVQILQESLRNHIAATRYNGQLPVLLIDDAHLLPLATLKTIVDLAMQGEPLTRLRVVLFCEPQITSILATPDFEVVQNTLIHILDVPPLSKAQLRDYIKFSLQDSQYNTIHPFNSEVIKKIYAESEGVPGEINLYAQQVLHRFTEHHRHHPLSRTLPKHKLLWFIPLILLLIGIALLIYWRYPMLVEQRPLPLPLQQTPTSTVTPTPPTVVAPAITTSTETTKSAKTEPTTVEPESPPTEQISPLEQPTEKTSTIRGEAWLRTQNPNDYTLQILGAHDELTLQRFLVEYPLEQIAVFETRYRGKDWYVLLHGIYPNRQQALAALEKLSPMLRQKTQPWTRKLASIQKLIKTPE
jgi:DamX protein